MVVRRRRPLMRAAMIGGVGYASYQAGKRGAEQSQHEYEQDAQLDQLRQQQAAPPAPAPPPASPPPPPAPAASGADRIEALGKLKELLDAGVLTQEEFDAEKRRILSS